MKKEINLKINRSIDHEILHSGYELVDLIPIPDSTDEVRRFKSLHEILKDFDEINYSSDFKTYVLQVRKKNSDEKTFKATSKNNDLSNDSIYLPNGKLNAQYLLENVKILMNAGENTQAKKILFTLIKNAEKMGESLFLLAQCLENENQIEDAIKKYEESILFQPRIETFQHYSNLLIKLNRHQTAADILEKTLLSKELTKKVRIELLMKSSEVWSKCNQPVKAEKNLRKALEICPDHIEALLKCGELALEKNNGEEARQYFNLVLREKANHPNALFGLGRATLLLGDQERAHDLFIQSLDLNIHNAKAIFHLVKIAYEIKSYDQASTVLKKYIDHTAFNAHLLYSLAGLEFHLGQYEDAIRTLKRILSVMPEHQESINLLSIIERKL